MIEASPPNAGWPLFSSDGLTWPEPTNGGSDRATTGLEATATAQQGGGLQPFRLPAANQHTVNLRPSPSGMKLSLLAPVHGAREETSQKSVSGSASTLPSATPP